MSASFIAFIFIVVAVVGVFGYRLGTKVKSLDAQKKTNTKPYEKCVAENDAAFKYGSFTDARDGETYRTIQIGSQVWMAESLRFKADECYAPDNEEANVKKFGRLYTWDTALKVAPEGWHIPSDNEWRLLMDYVSKSAKNANDELRSNCLWENPGSDSFGFFALPAGYRFNSGVFCQFGKRVRFWCNTDYGPHNAYRFSLTNEAADIEGIYKSDALSIRCVKDA